MLFLLVIEYLIKASGILDDPGCGFYFGPHPTREPGTFGKIKFPREWCDVDIRIWYLMFADDLVLLCHDLRAVNRILALLDGICKHLGINVNFTKSKVMRLSRGKHESKLADEISQSLTVGATRGMKMERRLVGS